MAIWVDCTQIQFHSPWTHHHRPKMTPQMKSNLSAIKNNYFKCILKPNCTFLLGSIYNICIICWKHLRPNNLANLPKTPFFSLAALLSSVYSFDIETQLNKLIFSAWENGSSYARLCVCVRPKLNQLCKNWITSHLCVFWNMDPLTLVILLLFYLFLARSCFLFLTYNDRQFAKRKTILSRLILIFYFIFASGPPLTLRSPYFFFIRFDWIFI